METANENAKELEQQITNISNEYAATKSAFTDERAAWLRQETSLTQTIETLKQKMDDQAKEYEIIERKRIQSSKDLKEQLRKELIISQELRCEMAVLKDEISHLTSARAALVC